MSACKRGKGECKGWGKWEVGRQCKEGEVTNLSDPVPSQPATQRQVLKIYNR